MDPLAPPMPTWANACIIPAVCQRRQQHAHESRGEAVIFTRRNTDGSKRPVLMSSMEVLTPFVYCDFTTAVSRRVETRPDLAEKAGGSEEAPVSAAAGPGLLLAEGSNRCGLIGRAISRFRTLPNTGGAVWQCWR